MPGGKHLAGASPKRQRMYEHIRESELESGVPVAVAKRIAAATTNKARTAAGEVKKPKFRKAPSGRAKKRAY